MRLPASVATAAGIVAFFKISRARMMAQSNPHIHNAIIPTATAAAAAAAAAGGRVSVDIDFVGVLFKRKSSLERGERGERRCRKT